MGEAIVFGGSSCQTLAKEVADELNFQLGVLTLRKFPDGERYLRVESEVKDKECVVIQSTCAPQDENILELLTIQETLHDLGASKIFTVVPYYGYGRQDRSFNPGEAVTSRVVAKHVQMNSDAFYSVNLHDEGILKHFTIPATNIDASSALGEYFKTYEMEAPIVVAPDDGAVKLAEGVAKMLGCQHDYLEKTRLAPGSVEMKPKNLSVADKDIILVDDIIDSGSTILEAMKMLRVQNARSVLIGCVHPVLTGSVIAKLFATGAIDVVATNTIPSQISFITVATLIANALDVETEGEEAVEETAE